MLQMDSNKYVAEVRLNLEYREFFMEQEIMLLSRSVSGREQIQTLWLCIVGET